MKLASVILDIPTQALDAPYTYAVPEEAGDQPIEVGCAVLVPFGPRQAVGFVIGIEERAEGDCMGPPPGYPPYPGMGQGYPAPYGAYPMPAQPGWYAAPVPPPAAPPAYPGGL